MTTLHNLKVLNSIAVLYMSGELLNVNIRVRVMMFNTTFNNILAISWRSVLMVEETGVHGENH